ncbi:hypothetical protein [Streptomyces sp. NPDC102360]|uniref:hypothetical protein n=1 Tax=Streptomyces sp. NPDC102360 TaxID=3366160 RepID=UPI00382266D3
MCSRSEAVAVGELTASACQFTPESDIYVSLRYRDNALRVTVYDGHPPHTNRYLAAACDTRRRAAFRLLVRLVRECGGGWGYRPAWEPGGGKRAWVALPRAGAAAYGS